MKSILTFAFLSFLFSICFSQTSSIKSRTVYSIRDTTGVNFKDSLQMSKYRYSKESYDLQGRLLEEILFNYSKSFRDTFSKITRYRYCGDTTYTKIFTDKNHLVSEVTQINLGNRKHIAISTHHFSITHSYLTKLEHKYIVTIYDDSLQNLRHISSAYDLGNHIDTIRSYTTIIRQEAESIDSIKVEQIAKLKYDNLEINGFHKIVNNDTTYISYQHVLFVDDTKKYIQRLRIDNVKGITAKSESFLEKDLSYKSIQYYLTDRGWEIYSINKRSYNKNNDLLLSIREDYYNGNFSRSHYSYFQYEYY
ncbi:MAG: hypothetical protein MI974_31165 [Chitinophagales bacterium]|nr:hypothetical protein [Chitinophagales bacterium]